MRAARLVIATGTLAVIGALGAPAGIAGPDSPPETALADYVSAPDRAYEWRVHARHELPGAEVVELRLHSQSWKDVLWKHRLHVIRPDEAPADARQALLVVAGGRWRESYDDSSPSSLPDDSALFVTIARQLGTVVAVLGQVPFQPIFDLHEDELIAHTFVRYLETGDAEWPLLLPMVKSVIKAMDATQAFVDDEWSLAIDRFTVLGASKRGWTTYLTGAVDERAATLVPIVIDVLNLEAHMPYQERVWGEPSAQIAPYTRRNLHEVLVSEAGSDLRRIVDPYSYRARLTQPKLVVVATNDAYFPVDALNLYWRDLPDPKHVLYLPNNEHDIDDFARLLPALGAIHRNGMHGSPMPELEWEFDERDGRLRLCVRGRPAPRAVTAWTAASNDTDFRDERFSPTALSGADGVFVHDLGTGSAHRAMFAEAVFEDGSDAYVLSTNVRVIGPDGEAPFFETAIDARNDVCLRD